MDGDSLGVRGRGVTLVESGIGGSGLRDDEGGDGLALALVDHDHAAVAAVVGYYLRNMGRR